MSRVFVVQQPLRWDEPSQNLVPKFDLTPARTHGEVVHLLGPKAAPWRPESVIKELQTKLQDFNDDDCLLLTGNPCLIGWAVAVAADINGGRVKLLQWSGKDGKYIPITADLYEDPL